MTAIQQGTLSREKSWPRASAAGQDSAPVEPDTGPVKEVPTPTRNGCDAAAHAVWQRSEYSRIVGKGEEGRCAVEGGVGRRHCGVEASGRMKRLRRKGDARSILRNHERCKQDSI